MVKKLFIGLGLILVVLPMAFADTETLTVSSCTVGGCSTSNYNTNTTGTIGATVTKSVIDTTGYTDSAVGGADTINSVTLRFYHGGAGGIGGTTSITYQSVGGGTTYCTDSVTNTATPTYVEKQTSGCSWTGARLDDLEIAYLNGDDKGPTDAYYYFSNVYVDYTPTANTPPTWTVNLGDSPDTLYAGNEINYTATGNDPDGDNYRLTVCENNGITNGYPGTCTTGSTWCTTSPAADDTMASCGYVTVAGDIGTHNAYGFLCDEGSITCSAVTSESTTVNNNKPAWSVNLADSPDPVGVGGTITYTATGTDFEGNQYRMTVCTTDSITDAYPGTCNGGETLCTSTATNSGVQTSCDNTTNAEGTITAYGFLCDSGSSTCNTSTSTTTLVSNLKGLIPENSGVPFWTNMSNPATSANFSCLGSMGDGDSCNVTWWVNSTGTINDKWEFWAYANSSVIPTAVLSTKLNHTIVAGGAADSCTYGGSGDWDVYYQDNCTFTTNTDIGANKLNFIGDGGSVTFSGGVISCREHHITPEDFDGDAVYTIVSGGVSVKP